ncbi:hypothetical protein [Rhizobium sp. Root1220]|uniref:hypothetical protein n=1 Tax=Rhizobium sp. Root1220 TaxID=1736432 RepID=UPI0006FB3D6B|nr:hypothetical protein [Rhizobium sp. Root1220]KQV68102.1 hypothetical protein ASC90_10625 [Rhizobium sp. Root1220]
MRFAIIGFASLSLFAFPCAWDTGQDEASAAAVAIVRSVLPDTAAKNPGPKPPVSLQHAAAFGALGLAY